MSKRSLNPLPASSKAVLLTAAAALPVLALSWTTSYAHISDFNILTYALLLCLTLLTSCTPVYLHEKRFLISPTMPMTMAANYLFSSWAAVSIVLITTVFAVVQMVGIPRIKKDWPPFNWCILMNCAVTTLATGIPTIAYHSLYRHHVFPHHSFLAGMFLSLAAICAFYINAISMTILSSIFTKTRWDVIWYQSYRWTWISTILLAPLGFLMGALIEQNVMFGVAFILMPLFAVHQGYSRHEREIATYRQGIDLLGRLMQESHPYTHGHLNRVASWAVKIAEHLNLGAESMAQIENAAILHDIGKIAIDDGILNKIEKLSDAEWNKIKEHPSVGAEIASRMKYLEQVSLWIRHHHERIDGKGYPAGLAGDAIPVESKIICVVDAYDAMVGGPAKSDQRPYRAAKTVEQARSELIRCSGTQFDEIVVNAFLAVLDKEAVEEQVSRSFSSSELTLGELTSVSAIPAAVAAIAATDAATRDAAFSSTSRLSAPDAIFAAGAGTPLKEAA